MSEEDLQQQIIDLQARLAFQEDTLESLNDEIARQDKALDLLRIQVKRWESRLEDMASSVDSGANSVNERPPHY